MGNLNDYREFFQKQDFDTRTYKNEDDVKEWWVLELKFNGIIKGAFIFDYKTEKLIKW